jgi:hypothetical protein
MPPRIKVLALRHDAVCNRFSVVVSIRAYFVLGVHTLRGCIIVVLGPNGVLDTTVDEK